jgi:hypothetical protein
MVDVHPVGAVGGTRPVLDRVMPAELRLANSLFISPGALARSGCASGFPYVGLTAFAFGF